MDQYHLAVSGERDGLWDWDLVSNRVHFSPRWTSMVGCEEDEIGSSPEEWLRRVHAEDQPRVRREIEAHLASGVSGFDLTHRIRHRDGSYRWMACRGVVVRDEGGFPVRLIGSHVDVTADHVADPLTGLPNRDLLIDRLARAIERTRRMPDFLYALLLIDVDSSLPEETARRAERDPVLTASARRLETVLRGTADSPFPAREYVVARLRNSQFAVLLEGLSHVAEAQTAAQRVLAALLAPLQLQGRSWFPQASIGVAVSATGYSQTEDVMRDADAALYRARSLGANRCEVFDIDLVQSAEACLAIEADLERALERGQFLLFYQPVVETATRRIVGLEALARWQHPVRGMIPPQEFIPIAERTGFIVALEHWTLREACRQLKAWQTSLPVPNDLWVSVNLSGVHFMRPGIVERVGDVLRETGVDGACLMLELTESAVVEDPAAVRTLLMQLRVMGVRIGIDDFGTGHSSFAYLHQFPADFLKLDQSFVRGVEVRQEKAHIVGTVAQLAGQLGLHVVAEGIENEAGLDLVRSRRCEYLQGFLFSPPVAADEAAALLRDGVAPHRGSGSDAEGPRADPGGAPQHSAGRRMRTWVPAGVATLAIVVSVGLAGRFTRGTGVAGPPAPLRAVDLPASMITPAPPSTVTADAAWSATAAPIPPGSKVRSPAVTTLTVEHQHVFGRCQGVLRVSSSGVSFASEDSKDAFTFAPGRFECALESGGLTIRDGRRTYRFKAAPVGGNRGTGQALRRTMEAIAGLRAK